MPDRSNDLSEVHGAGMPAPSELEQEPTPEELAAASEPPLTAGSCILRRPEVAEIVQRALLYFEGDRYHLSAWSVMPNHVHTVVQPTAGHSLKAILHSWKSFTANRINRQLGRCGALWERECFDHLIRRPEHVARFIRYVEDNPVDAGLCGRPEDWPHSNRGMDFQPVPLRFVDPRETPFVSPRSRGELPHLHKPGGVYFVTWRLLDAVAVKGRDSDGQ